MIQSVNILILILNRNLPVPQVVQDETKWTCKNESQLKCKTVPAVSSLSSGAIKFSLQTLLTILKNFREQIVCFMFITYSTTCYGWCWNFQTTVLCHQSTKLTSHCLCNKWGVVLLIASQLQKFRWCEKVSPSYTAHLPYNFNICFVLSLLLLEQVHWH